MKKVYSRIESITGNVITVRAEGVRYGELAEVTTRFGVSLAEVIRLDEELVSLQVFAGGRGISTGDEVRFLGHPDAGQLLRRPAGPRSSTARASPRDKGPRSRRTSSPIGGPSVNPTKRIIPREMIRTGIPMIDLFNSLVKSQKLPIFSVSGEPYNPLLARIAMQARGRHHHPRRHGPQVRRLPLSSATPWRRAAPCPRPSCSSIPPRTRSSSASWSRTSPWPWPSASP